MLSGDWARSARGSQALDWLGAGFKGLISWGWEGLEAAGIWIADGAVGVGRWLLDGFLSSAAWTGRLIAKIGAYFSGGRGIGATLFHTINFNNKVTATAGSDDAGWLVHEMIHVWPYEHAGGQYIGEAIHAGATVGYKYGTSTSWSDDGNGTFLDQQRQAAATFATFNREQQGDLTSHYYMRLSNGKDVAHWEPYIEDLRAGVG